MCQGVCAWVCVRWRGKANESWPAANSLNSFNQHKAFNLAKCIAHTHTHIVTQIHYILTHTYAVHTKHNTHTHTLTMAMAAMSKERDYAHINQSVCAWECVPVCVCVCEWCVSVCSCLCVRTRCHRANLISYNTLYHEPDRQRFEGLLLCVCARPSCESECIEYS